MTAPQVPTPEPFKDPFALWQNAYEGRLRWAAEARDQALASLSRDVRDQLNGQGDEAFVALFGRTQVGKTTLLLDLMNVHLHQVKRVSLVLRGGRELGRSATATAMEYAASADDTWRLNIPGQAEQGFADDAGITAALARLRTAMESGAFEARDPVVVSLPTSVFAERAESAVGVRVLDLPGDQPAHAVEQAHVEQVAQRHLPRADLILLVGRADDLSFLQPKVLCLPHLEDWQLDIDRFRVVTTFSFKPESLRALTRQPGLTVEQLRERLLSQLNTFDGVEDLRLYPGYVFPMEFGDSLAQMKAARPEQGAVADALTQACRAELLRHIQDAVGTEARLRSVFRWHVLIAKLKKRKLAERQMNVVGLERSLGEALSQVDRAKQSLRNAQDKQAQAEQELTNWRSLDLKSLLRAHCNRAFDLQPPWQTPDSRNASVSDLQANLRGLRARLRDLWSDREAGLHQPLATVLDTSELDPNIRRQVSITIDAVLDPLERKLEGYTLKTYWIDGNRRLDLHELQSRAQQACEELSKLAQACMLEELKPRAKALKKAERRAANEVIGARLELDDAIQNETRCRVEVDAAVVSCDQYRQHIEADLQRAVQVAPLFDSAYAKALSGSAAAVANAPSATSAFMALLGAATIIEARASLFPTGSI